MIVKNTDVRRINSKTYGGLFFFKIEFCWNAKHVTQIKFQRPKSKVALKPVGVSMCPVVCIAASSSEAFFQISTQNYLLRHLFRQSVRAEAGIYYCFKSGHSCFLLRPLIFLII